MVAKFCKSSTVVLDCESVTFVPGHMINQHGGANEGLEICPEVRGLNGLTKVSIRLFNNK